jgi:acetyl-CoA carboxylase biotin carboxyl carrier protein
MTEQQIDQIRELSDWLSGTDIGLLELTGPDRTIRLLRNGDGTFAERAVQAAPAKAPTSFDATVVRAGSVGIYLDTHPLRTEPLVRVGDEVAEGQAVALLRIGLVMLGVRAPRAGIVSRIVATNGSAVGYGDPLVELE